MARTRGKVGLIVAGLCWGSALGLALGALVLAPAMPGSVDLGVSDSKAGTSDDAQRDDSDRAAAQIEADAANTLLAEESATIVSRALQDVPVTIVRTAVADDEDVEAVRWLLNAAGAADSGTITLTERFTDQASADELSSIVANTLPAGAQLSVQERSPGTHAGESLAAVLFSGGAAEGPKAQDEDRALVLDTLRSAQFIEYSGAIAPAGAMVIVDGPSRGGDFGANVLGDFARALSASGSIVLASQDVDPEPLDSVNVVGAVDREVGRIQSVLAAARAKSAG